MSKSLTDFSARRSGPEKQGGNVVRVPSHFDPPRWQVDPKAFVATLGHEMRGPLATIHSALDLLCRHRSDPTTREVAERILNRQTQYLSLLVEDMLTFFGSGTERSQLRRQPTVLQGLVDQAIETVRPLATKLGHQLEVVLPSEPVVLVADRTRLVQVLVNLLSNAVKYTKAGGRIGLIAECDSRHLVLRVRDDGIGIDPDDLPYVFEPFWRPRRARDHSPSGLGIGLALVRRFVELHGGEVSALSAGVGHGAEFVVCLPRIMSDEKHMV
jgi:two-component system, sensor histidine kinase